MQPSKYRRMTVTQIARCRGEGGRTHRLYASGTDCKRTAMIYLALRPMSGMCSHLHGNTVISSISPVANPICPTAIDGNLNLTLCVTTRHQRTKWRKPGFSRGKTERDATFRKRDKRGSHFLSTAILLEVISVNSRARTEL